MLTIRPLDPRDSIEELTHLLHRAYARLGAMGLNYSAVDQTPDDTARRIAGGQCLVAEWCGALAGTIVVRPPCPPDKCPYFERSEVATVCQFAVEPALQGRGIGQALLRQCEQCAREYGCRELALDTAETAEHLIRFYANLGYEHVGFVQWPGKSYRSVLMSKTLGERP